MPDQKELPLILDLDNLLDSIRGVPTIVLETKYQYQQLKEEFYNYRKESESQINSLKEQLVEFMTLFRRIELGR